MTTKISSPDGRAWRVSRRRLPWRPYVRDIDALNRYSTPDVTFMEFLLSGPIFWVLYPIVMVFRFLLTYGIFLTEWLLALTLIPVAFAIRATFPVSWPVYAVTKAPDGSAVRYIAAAQGRDGTARLIETVAAEIASSGAPSSLKLAEAAEYAYGWRA